MNIYEEVINETLFQGQLENYLSNLEDSVPPLIKFYCEQFLTGQKKEGIEGLEEIGELLEIAGQYITSGTNEDKRLNELRLLFLEALAFIEEHKNA